MQSTTTPLSSRAEGSGGRQLEVERPARLYSYSSDCRLSAIITCSLLPPLL